MSSRKFATIGIIIGLSLGSLPAFAQEPTPEPTQQQDQQAANQGDLVSVVVAGDVLDRARNEYTAQDYQKAVQDYSLFIMLNPTFSQGYFLRGLAYSSLNDLDHALEDMNQALAFPQSSKQATAAIYTTRAVIYLLQNNVDSAMKDLDASIAAAPDVPEAYAQRARLYLLSQDFENAVKDYTKVIELAPDVPQAYAGRAFANTNLGNVEEALADYDHLIALQPDNPEAYVNRARLNAAQKKYDAALTDFNAAIKLKPDEPGYYLQRGLVNTALNKPADTGADYLEWVRRQETRSVDADPLKPGESQVVSLAQGLTYNLPFEAIAGQKATLSATARPDSKTDPLIVLLDTSGKPVAGDDDSGGNYDAQIKDFVVPADGTYTLVVSPAGGNPDGPVRVLLQLAN